MDYALIAHGGWIQSAGQRFFNNADGVEHEDVIDVPNGLTICIYNLQNTSLRMIDGLILLNRLLRSNLEFTEQGHHYIDGLSIDYKEFKYGTQSSAISNYSLGSDVRGFTGLYEVGNVNPRLDLWDGTSTFLEGIIDAVMADGEAKKLHLLCCQNFY